MVPAPSETRVRATLVHQLRSVLPWAAGTALFILAMLALQSVFDREEETRRAMREQLEERLADRVTVWEQALVTELDDLIRTASDADVDLAAIERLWRTRSPGFDALYVWGLGPAPAPGAPGSVVFRHPVPHLGESSEADEACVRAARVPRADDPPRLSATVMATRLLTSCVEAPRRVRAFASSEAAQMLRDAETPNEALTVLTLPDLRDELPLTAYDDVGVARRAVRRLLRADLLDDVKRPQQAQRLRLETVRQILALDAPDLEATLFLVPGIVERLQARGQDVRALQTGFQRAEQRLAAYRELQQLALRGRDAGRVTEAARFAYDQYSDTPFLLYYRRDADGGGVALQLRQGALLDTFLGGGGRIADQIVVTDLGGTRVAGAVDQPPSDLGVVFGETLRHLRASFTAPALEARLRPGGRFATWMISLVTGACVILGLGAIWQQAQASERQRLLLQRQRDFTARVTHELKTPLAGIRVMADNLAVGAFKDDRQRSMMAQRILDEADRLTQRVDEILQVARKRELPRPEPYDLEEIVYMLLEDWGPRYEQLGVRLHVDVAPLDPLVGDERAIRDAIACLLDNALKYRREDIDSAVWMNVREDGRWAEIEVVDNGLGVPPDQREAVFERFVRVEGPNRGKSGGHGLGLAQVAEIVEGHRGSVRCEDGIDGGARFVVRLPLAG